jgi:hypothetical protein
MLGHNETQLDSYNKNAPKAHGSPFLMQAHSSLIGSNSAFIARTRARAEPWQRAIFPKSIKTSSSLEKFPLPFLKMIRGTAFSEIQATRFPVPKIISIFRDSQLRQGKQQGRLIPEERKEALTLGKAGISSQI